MTIVRRLAMGTALCWFLLIGLVGSARAEAEQTVQLLQQYIRLDTVNPPGNEMPGAQFLAAIFERRGIPYEIVESQPGRANIWARLPGGNQPGLLLLHHMDVVPADTSRWSHPPFAARLVDGFVHGRGSLDNKSAGIFQLQAFLALHAAGKPLNRDVVFMATADEEAGGKLGVGWLWQHRPEVFDGIGAVLNEGGGGDLSNGKLSFGIEVTQKLPLWLIVKATGMPGHGAVPRQNSAPQKLIQALAALDGLQFEARVVPIVAEYLRRIAIEAPAPWDKRLTAPQQLVASPKLMAELQGHDYRLHALLTNTCVVTRLRGSEKINVVPPLASAEVDCRLLPDESAEAVLSIIRDALAGEGVTVESVLSFGPGTSSKDNFLYKAIESILAKRYPGVLVLPKLNAGFTDSHFFRERGISAYGFTPIILMKEESAGVHGDNESISLENIELGDDLMRAIVTSLVYD